MFRDEGQVICEAHGRLQARMGDRVGEMLGIEFADPLEQPLSFRSETGKDTIQRLVVVTGFVGFAIGQVGDCELGIAVDVVFHSGQPERLHIEKMAGFFLGGPFSARRCNQNLLRMPAQRFFQSCGRASQARQKIRHQFNRKRCVEAAFKPERNLTHLSYDYRRYSPPANSRNRE